MKKIGFLSFGHWSAQRGSATRTAGDALLQAIDLSINGFSSFGNDAFT